LAFSQISLNICGALMKAELMRKKSRKKSSRKSSKKSKSSLSTSIPPSKNKWYQLVVGMLVELANLSDKEVAQMNDCIPTDWQSADTSQESSGGSGGSNGGQSQSNWTTILDGLEKIIGVVCKFKDQIKKLLTGKIRRQVMRYQYRMLLQRSMTRFKRAVGWFDAIKKGVSSFADAAWNAVKGVADGFVKHAKVFIDTVRQKFTAFLKSDIVQKIKVFADCLQKAKASAMKIINAVKKLIELVKKIMQIVGGDMVTLGKLIVDLICNFSLFRKAFTFLSKALNVKDEIIKYSLMGKFIGTFLRAASQKGKLKHI